jgi:hypothetical protein
MQYKSLSRQNAAGIVTAIALWMTVGGMVRSSIDADWPAQFSHAAIWCRMEASKTIPTVAYDPPGGWHRFDSLHQPAGW